MTEMGWLNNVRQKNQELKLKSLANNSQYKEIIELHWRDRTESISDFLKLTSIIILIVSIFPIVGFIFSVYLGVFFLIFPIFVIGYVIYRSTFIAQAIETFYSTDDELILEKIAFGKTSLKKWQRPEIDYIVVIKTGRDEDNPKWEFLLGIGEEPESKIENYFLSFPSKSSKHGKITLSKLIESQFKVIIVNYDKMTWCGECITSAEKYEQDTEVECSECESSIQFR
ncbi:MAG: hypothetical protein ACW99A_05075 [Candidatus Kariarchaeaceae archaeon]|jgi:hypothetical protein